MHRLILSFTAILFILTGGWLSAQEPPPEILKAEIRELKTVIKSLHEENQQLKKENEKLRKEILRRPQSTGSAPAPTPSVSSRNSTPPQPGPTPVPETGHAVLYVNSTWGYLTVNAGSNEGITEGAEGMVIRKNRKIAHVKVTGLKESQSVMDIIPESLTAQGIYPSAGDRIVFP